MNAHHVVPTRKPASRLRVSARYARRGLHVLRSFASDWVRYMRYSSTVATDRDARLLGRIAAKYHSIEKGLSLPAPRLGFGENALRQLLDHLAEYGPERGGETLNGARDAMAAYVAFHRTRDFPGYPLRGELDAMLVAMGGGQADVAGGLRHVARDDIVRATAGVTEDFFLQRHSVRQFSDVPVSADDIEAAVRVAQKAPVVCNRQSGRVHVIADPALKREVLRRQAGAKGFSDGIDTVLLVTTDLSNFWNAGERNQCWVDGGLFAMSLIFGLHARGLGTIPLNWSKAADSSERMRRLLGLEPSEVIILLVGVGTLRDTFSVPMSRRKDVNDVLRVHGAIQPADAG